MMGFSLWSMYLEKIASMVLTIATTGRRGGNVAVGFFVLWIFGTP